MNPLFAWGAPFGAATQPVYFSKATIRSTRDAFQAVRQAATMAMAEDPSNVALYKAVRKNAPNYGKDVPTILKTGRGQLGLAPKADKWLLGLAHEYWLNVEGGARTVQASVPPEALDALTPESLPITARSWFIPAVAGTVLAGLGGAAWWWTKKRKKR
jgi:hypothetical protein